MAAKKIKKKTAKPAAKSAAKSAKSSRQKPIQLYYWPTPNGWKVSIMLEECGLPYKLKPVNIGQGDQFKPAFLKISPNNRMPAIIDPQGPGDQPISIFESGAILQYLGRKTKKFYPRNERDRVAVDEWLFWQMGGLGPMAGQAHHFRQYAQEKIPYAVARYTDEVNRLYGVMNTQLKKNKKKGGYLAGKYSIADMACWGWVLPYKLQGQDLDKFPHLKNWFHSIGERPAVQRGFEAGAELRSNLASQSEEAKKARSVLFGQRSR